MVVPCSLTCNPTRTLPNQVSYLKESSMESFTLRPTRKIESVVAQQHHTCNGFRGNLISSTISQNNFSEHLWNSILNSCSSQCPGASIYRLRYRMGDCRYMLVSSGRWTWSVRTDNCATDFPENFSKKSFMFKSSVRTMRKRRLDGHTSAASNFHIRLSRVRTMGDERPDG